MNKNSITHEEFMSYLDHLEFDLRFNPLRTLEEEWM